MRIPFNQPRRISEANIQAELYRQLKMRQIDSYLEYRVRGVGRLDIVVIDRGYIACIVECKSYSKSSKEANYATKQIAKYKALGVPVIILKRLEDMQKTVDVIISIMSTRGASI